MGNLCGNGNVGTGETCDDGNQDNLDGCDGACQKEPGFDCPALGGLCVPRCGDNRVVAGEECDDGNLIAGDGCDATCLLEHTCGNHLWEPTEDCDDGPSGSVMCNPGCRVEAAACGVLLDLSDGAVATTDGAVTWLEALVGGVALSPESAPSPCGDVALPWRIWHRVVVGPRPAALDVEVEDTALQGRNSGVWWSDSCDAAVSTLACAASRGPARPARLSIPVQKAGSVLLIAVGLDGATAPTTYGLRITQRVQTRISGVTTCDTAPDAEPGVWTMDASTLGPPSLASCSATGDAAVARLHLPALSDVTAQSPGAALQAWTDGCASTAALACSLTGQALVTAASDVWLRAVVPAGTTTISMDVRAATQVANGAPCDGQLMACPSALRCVGSPGTRVCVTPTGALANITAWDPAFVVEDGLADGRTWSSAATGVAQVLDDAAAGTTEEILTLPTLDASLASGLFFSMHHALDGHGTGYVDVQSQGGAFIPIATVRPGEAGLLTLDLTPWAAGSPEVQLRLRLSRGTTVGAPGAGWRVDDLLVLPY